MAVAGPGVGQRRPVDEVRPRRARRGPQAERAVDVHPGAVVPGERDRRAQVVAGPGVDVAGLQADDRRPRRTGGEHPAQVGDVDRAVRVRRHLLDGGRAQAQQPQRAVDRRVPLGPGHDPHLRRADQPVPLDVPARPGQDVVPAGRQAHGVRGLPPGDEPDGRAGRQAEQLGEPPPGGLLRRRGGGGEDGVERALVPARGEHLGRGRRRQRAADDETEVPRSSRRHQPALGGRDQRVHHLTRRRRGAGQRAAERGADGLNVLPGAHRPFAEAGPVRRGDGGGAGE